MGVSAESSSEFNQSINDLLFEIVKQGRDLKEKQRKEKEILKKTIKNYGDQLRSIPPCEEAASSGQVRQLTVAKASVVQSLEEATVIEDRLKQQATEARYGLEDSIKKSQEQSKKGVDCMARSLVNLYRDVSKIYWSKNEQEPCVVRGLYRGNKPKSFRFNEEKQTEFFIVNSLWDTGNSDP